MDTSLAIPAGLPEGMCDERLLLAVENFNGCTGFDIMKANAFRVADLTFGGGNHGLPIPDHSMPLSPDVRRSTSVLPLSLPSSPNVGCQDLLSSPVIMRVNTQLPSAATNDRGRTCLKISPFTRSWRTRVLHKVWGCGLNRGLSLGPKTGRQHGTSVSSAVDRYLDARDPRHLA